MITPIFKFSKTNGEIHWKNRQQIINYQRSLSDGNYEITIKEEEKRVSVQQHRYYRGVVVPIIAEEYGEYNLEETHQFLASMFLQYTHENGTVFVRSTTSLSTKEMTDYVEKCRHFASTELETYIPDPNEVEYA